LWEGLVAKKGRHSTRLPKAPLAEVVFELRWNLQVGPQNQAVLHSDPGLLPLLDAFGSNVKKAKFGFVREMSHPLQTGPYGVVRRYFRDSETPYPILQVGVGIFAANASSQYEWPTFKDQVLLGTRALLSSYPKMDFFSLSPNLLELRYIDLFDKAVTGGADFFEFLNRDTSFDIGLPTMLRDRKIVSGVPVGRFTVETDLKTRKSSRLIVDVASAKHGDDQEDAIRMVTIVRTTGAGVLKLNNKATFLGQVAAWLDFAHEVTSPLFREIVSENIMRKFQEL
jgi:uncharacterized protein (TIGR04255 family)